MGTNYYVVGHRRDDDPKYHIGKRSAAGWYCWDCNVTLCVGGNSKVHYDSPWHEACPVCGKNRQTEGLSMGSAGRELGFNKEPFAKKTGVASCSSFTWARDLGRVKKVVDEYGTVYTIDQFNAMLLECPIQFDHKGAWFS